MLSRLRHSAPGASETITPVPRDDVVIGLIDYPEDA